MPIKTAEPKRITTYVYNGQPDPFKGDAIAVCAPADALLPDGKPIAVLCKKVELATTDAAGAIGFNAAPQADVATREWAWTYNRTGQVLSADGPRTDVNDSVTYSYYADTTADHTQGDLKSVTNGAGHVTQFTRYNRHGQVLQIVDANGFTTDYTYDLRLRLTSANTGGQIVSYEYEPTGNLRQVTQPDGSYLRYTYDDAQRLTDIHDNTGNRISYTLDTMGNRLSEEVKDPAGVLARQITRVYDALSRVQSITGGAQ